MSATVPDPDRSSSPLRVLALIANESVSGPGRQLAALAGGLANRGVRMTVAILHRRGNPHPAYAFYLDRLGIDWLLVEDRGRLDFGIVDRIAHIIRERNIDLVQTHGYKATAVVWWLRRQRPELPWIGCFHGETHEDLKARFYHWLDHRLLAKADRVVVMSMLQLAAFAHVGERAGVIHNAVLPDPGLGGLDDAPRIRAAVKDLPRPIVGVVGRLSPEKGVDLFIEACALLRDNGDSFSAVIAGDGPEHDRIQAIIATLNLGGSIKLLGNVANVRALYDMIDVLAIPSRSEGLPNVLLEALGADVPVVSTRVGAVPEVLTDPLAGRIVPTSDPGALADGIRAASRLRNDPEAQRARAVTAHRFSAAARVDRHLAMYTELV